MNIINPETIPVELGKRSYNILVNKGWLESFGRKVREAGIEGVEVIVFTSPRIGGYYFEVIRRSLSQAGFTSILRHDIPDGEENKTLKEWGGCLAALLENFSQKGSAPLVVNLGGGVVGDIGGFAAGTFRRGSSCIQVPTTLLGLVDSGVGGKVAVNHGNLKNIIGMFHQPKLVFADLGVLSTLDKRELRSGVAEVIKYGVVCSHPLFEYLEENIAGLLDLDEAVLRHVVSECYRIKADIVQDDEEDTLGKRIVLNFGHTVGHALELNALPRLTHGEAISTGMIAALNLGIRLGVCSDELLRRVRDLLNRAGLNDDVGDFEVDFEGVMESMQHDKKSLNGDLRFVLANDIGRWEIKSISDQRVLRNVVRSVCA